MHASTRLRRPSSPGVLVLHYFILSYLHLHYAEMSTGPSLPDRLAAVLPSGLNLRVYHLSTRPISTSALFAPSPGREEQTTSCESHFLAVSSPSHGESKELLIYAIEVLIFATGSLTTIFVSKADSSGFSSRLNQPKGSPSAVAAITSAFVEFLIEPRLTNSRVVLSLFARAQNQYLFPGSSENAGKHILDDRQLIKWWCRVFDKTLREPRLSWTTVAHLLVPGCDKAETRAFFPPSSRTDPAAEPRWLNSYPVELMVPDASLPPRHIVPRLPDDPKARFLDDLDGDFIDEKGNWRSVKNLSQFWELMSYRQECSAGRLVGFLWLVFSTTETHQDSEAHKSESDKVLVPPCLPTPDNSQRVGSGVQELEPPASTTVGVLQESNTPPSSSPVQGEQEPKFSQTAKNGNDAAGPNIPTETIIFPVVERTQGEIIVEASQYQALMDHLLQTDFAGEDLAAKATESWINKALEISQATSFGKTILGCAAPVVAKTPAVVNAPSARVNVLTTVRKKRKADAFEDTGKRTDTSISTTIEAQTLSASVIRKKPKS